jgi:hypothetical protein
MSETQPSAKRPWHAPEIVEVGGVSEMTTGGDGNVRDPLADTTHVTYRPNTRSGNTFDEVELDDR